MQTGTEAEPNKKEEEGKRKPIWRAILNGIIDVLIVLFLAFALLNIYLGTEIKKNASASLFGKQARIVLTGSMEPNIPCDSLIIVDTSGDKTDYEVNDVLTFTYPAYGELPTTHRVIDKMKSVDKVTYILKGDAPGLLATQVIDSSAVIGKVVYHSLALGEIVRFSKGVGGYICFILVPCLLLLAYAVYLVMRSMKKEKAKKEASSADAPPEKAETIAKEGVDSSAKDKEIEELRRQIEELKKQQSSSEEHPQEKDSNQK